MTVPLPWSDCGELYGYYLLGKYIVAAPGVCEGRPTFKFTRIDVYYALGADALHCTMKD